MTRGHLPKRQAVIWERSKASKVPVKFCEHFEPKWKILMIRSFENPVKLFSTSPVSDLKIRYLYFGNPISFVYFLLSFQVLLKHAD